MARESGRSSGCRITVIVGRCAQVVRAGFRVGAFVGPGEGYDERGDLLSGQVELLMAGYTIEDPGDGYGVQRVVVACAKREKVRQIGSIYQRFVIELTVKYLFVLKDRKQGVLTLGPNRGGGPGLAKRDRILKNKSIVDLCPNKGMRECVLIVNTPGLIR